MGVLLLINACAFLAATLLVYAILPAMKTVHDKALKIYFLRFFLSCIFNILLQVKVWEPGIVCSSLGSAFQFSWLATYFWHNVMCIEMELACRTLRPGVCAESDTNKFYYYVLYADVIPAILTFLTIIMDIPDWFMKPSFEDCMFSDVNTFLFYFYGPTSVLMLLSLFSVMYSAIKISKNSSDISTMKANWKRWMLYFTLFWLMTMKENIYVVLWSVYQIREPFVLNSFDFVIAFILFYHICLQVRVIKILMHHFQSWKLWYCNQMSALKRIITFQSVDCVKANNKDHSVV